MVLHSHDAPMFGGFHQCGGVHDILSVYQVCIVEERQKLVDFSGGRTRGSQAWNADKINGAWKGDFGIFCAGCDGDRVSRCHRLDDVQQVPWRPTVVI